jgi:lambda family phage portal protein
MKLFGMFRSKQRIQPPATIQHRHFFSKEEGRFFTGWDTESQSVDYYLKTELKKLRARSRELVRKNPYGKRLLELMKSNIVGHEGIKFQAKTDIFRGGKVTQDDKANTAIEEAFKDWADNYADYEGRKTLLDFQLGAISNATQDGEFVIRIHRGASFGPYGFQLQSIDPEFLDSTKNIETTEGHSIRLGVEYDKKGRVVKYHFRKKSHYGSYLAGESYSIDAKHIIHGFISEWPDQSRGIPWTHAGIETAKHLEKFKEATIVRARAAAGTFVALTSKHNVGYEGDTADESDPDISYDSVEAGSIKDFGNREINSIDPKFPGETVEVFIKGQIRDLSAAWGVSYQSLSNDLSGTSFSSGRTGIMEERELYKSRQTWLIASLMRPVFRGWLVMGYTKQAIKIGATPLSRPVTDYLKSKFQGKRWQWVDPAKDAAANQSSIDNRLKSRSSIIREQGDDPETVFKEIEQEEALLASLNIMPVKASSGKPDSKDEDQDEEQDEEESTSKKP